MQELQRYLHSSEYKGRGMRYVNEAPKTMAAQVRTNQVNPVIRHPRTTFGAVIVNVNKRSVSADARAFIPNYLLVVEYEFTFFFLINILHFGHPCHSIQE